MSLESLPMNIADLVIVIILAISALFAFARGFIREVLSIAAWVGAALAAIWGFDYLRDTVRDLVGITLVADVLTAVGLFVVALMILSVLSGILAKGVRGTAVSAIDRTLGLLFGLLRGVVLVSLAYLFLVWLWPEPSDRPDWMQEARSLPLVDRGAVALVYLVPEDTRRAAAINLDDRLSDTERALERGRMLEELSRPTPSAPTGPQDEDAQNGQSGYNPEDRDELHRKFEDLN